MAHAAVDAIFQGTFQPEHVVSTDVLLEAVQHSFLTGAFILLVYASLPTLVASAAWHALERGNPLRALRISRCLSRLPAPGRRTMALWVEAHSHADMGYTARARSRVESLLRRLLTERRRPPPFFLPSITDVLVNSGNYLQAIDAFEALVTKQLGRRNPFDPTSYAMSLLNVAEALDNVGRSSEALTKLDEIRKLGRLEPFLLVALACSEAWILARQRRCEEARQLAQRILPTQIGLRYAAEGYYTLGVVAMMSEDFGRAMSFIEEGQRVASRAASVRNGQFLRAEVLLRMSDEDAAFADFERALRHRYKAQGGHTLALFAAAYERSGRADDAQRIRQLLGRRDPQFIAASCEPMMDSSGSS